jgi:uncharacterized membrane protein
MQPGESALFVVAREVKMDEVCDHLMHFAGEIIYSTLLAEAEVQLAAAFGTEAA